MTGGFALSLVAVALSSSGLASGRELADFPCVAEPVFPEDCVSRLGRLGGPVVTSHEEGFLHIPTPVVDPLLSLRSSNAANGLLYVLNPLSNSVRILDPARRLASVAEIRVCHGPSALAQSEDGSRLFVACYLSHAIAVIDTARQRLSGLIQDRDAAGRPRLQEPMAMAVVGTTLYVASSRNGRVGVVDTTSHEVVGYIDVPGQEPRSLAVSSDRRYLIVANFLAGNRSEPAMQLNPDVFDPQTPVGRVCAPLLADAKVRELIVETSPRFMDASHPSYPLAAECYFYAHSFGRTARITTREERSDHDVVVIDLKQQRVVHSTDSLTRDIGSLNYGVAVDPDGKRVYVATVHADNTREGRLGRRPLINRLAVLELAPDSGALSIREISDLDAPYLDDQGRGAAVGATPYSVTPHRGRLLIAAAGSDRLLITDSLGKILQSIPVGFTPKGVVARGASAWVFNAADQSVSQVDLDFGRVTLTDAGGPSPLSQPRRIGRYLFESAGFSSNGTFSCASCHPDGQRDGLVWQLNERDGLRATIGLHEIAETAPYHWDGSKCNLLKNLQDTFVDLFGAPKPPGDCELKMLIDHIEGLVRPHSPYRSPDDRLSRQALLGAAIFHRARFKGLDDEPRTCNRRLQDPAVEPHYLAATSDPWADRFAFNGGGGPLPSTRASESCSVANCHVTPHAQSEGFISGDPAQRRIDGFEAVSTMGGWDRTTTQHDGRTTRAKLIQALAINRRFHGAPDLGARDGIDGELASHAFHDSYFRHPEFAFDDDPATHGFELSDALTRFTLEQEDRQSGAVGLSTLLRPATPGESGDDPLLETLLSAASDGKVIVRACGTLGGRAVELTWKPDSQVFVDSAAPRRTTLRQLRGVLRQDDTLLVYGALPPGAGDVRAPKLRSVARKTSPILCAEGYEHYHATLESAERDVPLTIHGTDIVAGSRVLIDGRATGEPLAGDGPGFEWTLPVVPSTPSILSLQLVNPVGLLSASLPLPVVAPVVPADPPSGLTAAKTETGLVLSWAGRRGVAASGLSYDVFRGELSELRASGLAPGECLSPRSWARPGIRDAQRPASGTGFYYLARAQNQLGVTSWGTPRRDAQIDASPRACPVLFANR